MHSSVWRRVVILELLLKGISILCACFVLLLCSQLGCLWLLGVGKFTCANLIIIETGECESRICNKMLQ